MSWNIAPESISLVILGIIWVYSRKGSHIPTLKNRMFQGCLMVTFSAMLTNIISTVMIYHYEEIPLWATWTVTTIYFLLTPLMGLVYFLYSASVIYSEEAARNKIMGLGLIPGILYSIFILINPITRNIFYINAGEGYVRGSLVGVTYVVFYAYCVASIIMALANKSKIEPKIYRILSTFPMLAVLVIIVQQFFPDIILSGSAATCAMLIIYLHLQNKQISMDYLTNVPNRQELLSMLTLMLNRYPQTQFTLVVVSLRDFRQINNACGQRVGDEFLKAVCAFLCSLGKEGDVYRFNGDEFAVLFPEESDDIIKEYIMSVRKRMKQPWCIENYQFNLSAVTGIIRHQGEGDTLEHIIAAIEYAVHLAKSGKCGPVCYCDEVMRQQLKRRQQVEQILGEKMKDKSFEMYYQPIYCVETGRFNYAESLMRMNDTPIGPVYPSEFIPIAEETGMIIEITYIVLDKVCTFINRLLAEHIPIDAIHVNFPAVQFTQPDLAEKVMGIIQKNGTPPSAVKIEFTESTLAEKPQAVTDFAAEMKKYGIKMGLDDFGTGYSNFAMVINIPFETIKLDKSLVWAMIGNRNSALGVKNIVRTFKELGMTIVAEGVETDEQRQMVVDSKVDQIQGFYYARPMSEKEAETFLRTKFNVSQQ